MKVLNLYGINDLRLDEREIPEPKENEVLLKIKACGICSSDEARVLKTGTYHFPTVPGHEFAGQIVKLGKNVKPELLDKKAAVFPLLPCNKCTACKNEEYAMCSNYKYFGSRNDGGFSEYLTVPVWNLVLLDDSVEYEVGSLMEPSAVALHATNIAEVKENMNVAISGSGTIGILIGVFCKLKGANVYIIGINDNILNKVKSLGFETLKAENCVQEIDNITNNEKMDIVFEAVGTNESMENCILSTKNKGTIVAVGNPQDDLNLKKDVYWKVLRKQLIIKGTWNSDYSTKQNDWKEVAELMKENNFPFKKLITNTYPLEESKEAFDLLQDREKAKIKITFINK